MQTALTHIPVDMATASLNLAQRRLPAGAELLGSAGAHFRVWAPFHTRVELTVEDVSHSYRLEPEGNGYFSQLLPNAPVGVRYRYVLDGEGPYPDPVSRFQPDGPHGPSELIAPDSYRWNDAAWSGLQPVGQVLYELHLGTFTAAGTFHAARERLSDLRDLGVTCVELMPIADFAGEFGWGYDGVNAFAPHRCYGRPDDLRLFVDTAHQLGLGVILDVVYNHLGPAGNYLPLFSPRYFSERRTEWGQALNFDGEMSRPVRDFVCSNAAYWVREFHIDGFRLDATQSLFDSSEEHIVAELTRWARAAAGTRRILVMGENEPQDVRLLRSPEVGGYGLDALWNDDFHHSAVVALTGRREAYYSDYLGRAQELVAAAKHGYLYQGQYYGWQKQRRGSSTRGLALHSFVSYLENHDQVANSALGRRLWLRSDPGALRAMTGLLLLGPWTPLLFQGQEWCSEQPFPFFADHAPELAQQVHRGRRAALQQFPSLAARTQQERIPDPGAHSTFESAKLDWGSRSSERSQSSLRLHRDLLRLRREDPVLSREPAPCSFDGAVLSDTCCVLRWFSEDRRDRLLVINLGSDLHVLPAPEPLLAAPSARIWRLLWSSEELWYGGSGQPDGPLDAQGFVLPARCALLWHAISDEAP